MMDVLLPDGWPRPHGYSNGISATGRTVFVAGQVGWDPATGRIEPNEFAQQVRRALENVIAVLRAGGAVPADVARMTWFVTDLDAYRAARRELGTIWRELFGTHYPAMSVIGVSELLEPGALVEIEATATVEDRSVTAEGSAPD
jgi:enamine deaminase RidA (YjgF/YER057c/UK114 family)